MTHTIINLDCLEYLRSLQDNTFESVVTDPPYGLSFMGKKWDYDVPSVEIWRECLRVLKPGGHLLSFAGTRTQHRMAMNIEDAGFEIRDMIAWVYGNGFPKSLDVSKAIDKMAGAKRELILDEDGNQVWTSQKQGKKSMFDGGRERPATYPATYPATDAARKWKGWGTALKPALEPITIARKPLIGTVAENVQTYGTGAMNIDECRLEARGQQQQQGKYEGSNINIVAYRDGEKTYSADLGRWPANFIHDGSEEVIGLFGTAVRFFYCAKASKKDRDEGLEECQEVSAGVRTGRKDGSVGINAYAGVISPARNFHPTVKPTNLMRYLCRLITPPKGTILDPFMGSGSTGKAAKMEGFSFVGVEREKEYCEIAKKRIESAARYID
jgi:site-specific DNA-methyltransferase (adenine-specific)